jgi:hypothetical protein
MKKRAWSFDIRVRPREKSSVIPPPVSYYSLLVRRDLAWGNRQMYVDKIQECFSLLGYDVLFTTATKTKVNEAERLIPYYSICEYFKNGITKEKAEEYKPKGGKLKKGTRLTIDFDNPKFRGGYSGTYYDYVVEVVLRNKIGTEPRYILSYKVPEIIYTDPDTRKAITRETTKYTPPYTADEIFSWLAIVEYKFVQPIEPTKEDRIKPVEPQVRTKTEDQG